MKKREHLFWKDLRRNRVKWLMLVPAAVTVILMCYIPMAGIVLAFKEYNYHDGIFGSPWAGLKNFEFFFQSQDAWSVTRNTLALNFMFIAVGITPNSLPFEGLVSMDHGYIEAEEDGKTDVPGIFAAGDVRTKQLRQIVTAVADGANAVVSAERYLTQSSNLGRTVSLPE